MTDEEAEGLILRRDEGRRLFVYDDATGKAIAKGSVVVGNPTIGEGRRLDAGGRGISPAESDLMKANDITANRAIAAAWLGEVAWVSLTPLRRAVLVSIVHNVGSGGIHGFKRLRAALLRRDWAASSLEIVDSKLEPNRAWRLACIMRYDDLEPRTPAW